jgi:hypothetical protein
MFFLLSLLSFSFLGLFGLLHVNNCPATTGQLASVNDYIVKAFGFYCRRHHFGDQIMLARRATLLTVRLGYFVDNLLGHDDFYSFFHFFSLLGLIEVCPQLPHKITGQLYSASGISYQSV